MIGIFFIGFMSFLINYHIDSAYNKQIYTDTNTIPHNHVALLLVLQQHCIDGYSESESG